MTQSIESIGIIVGLMVTLIELVIIFKLRQHTRDLDTFLTRQFKLMDEHTKRLDAHVKDLDMHSHKLEESVECLLKENEAIYKKVCTPNLKLED